MAIFGSFGHCLPNILHTWTHDSFQVIRLSMTLGIFQGHWTMFHIKFLKNGVWYGKSYYRLILGNYTLAFDWSYFWWPWSTLDGHFRAISQTSLLVSLTEVLVSFKRCPLLRYLHRLILASKPCRIPACISMFSLNLTFDKTLIKQFCYFFLPKSPLFGI